MAFDLSMPILVVDDYSTMIRIIRNLLKQLGFENVDEASDGSAALAKMQTKRYGLVISDWNMEPMTGYDLLKEVRASPEFSKTPFIMITAESKTENVIAAKKAGVNNYIVKPFNAATLKTKMEAVFPGRSRLTSAGSASPPPGPRRTSITSAAADATICERRTPHTDVFSRAGPVRSASPMRVSRTTTVRDFHLRITLTEDSCGDQRSPLMFTFETSDQKEVRRFRIAQFNGRTATVRSAGSAGHRPRSLDRGKQVERSGGVDHHDHPGRAQADARVAARAARSRLHGRLC